MWLDIESAIIGIACNEVLTTYKATQAIEALPTIKTFDNPDSIGTAGFLSGINRSMTGVGPPSTDNAALVLGIGKYEGVFSNMKVFFRAGQSQTTLPKNLDDF